MRQATAEILKMRPVVPVEPLADLRTHVAEHKGAVHGLLAPFCVRGGDLVAPVVARPEIVFQLRPEGLRDAGVFDEDAVLPVRVGGGEGRRGDVLGDPVRVSGSAVVGEG